MSTVTNDATAVAYLASFDVPLSITVMSKTQSWPFLQQLGYNAQISYMNQDFHGVKDFCNQMNEYSSTQPMLTAAWDAIKTLAPSNPSILLEMYVDPTLGQVGNLFLQMAGFGQVFSVLSTSSSGTISAQVGL